MAESPSVDSSRMCDTNPAALKTMLWSTTVASAAAAAAAQTRRLAEARPSLTDQADPRCCWALMTTAAAATSARFAYAWSFVATEPAAAMPSHT